jgi:hypothetical protein
MPSRATDLGYSFTTEEIGEDLPQVQEIAANNSETGIVSATTGAHYALRRNQSSTITTQQDRKRDTRNAPVRKHQSDDKRTGKGWRTGRYGSSYLSITGQYRSVDLRYLLGASGQ